jgi:ABC-2 type transport system ATP-binding protein
VLVSSHLMSELQDTADHLLIVGRGRLIADTSTAALLAAAAGDRVRLRTSAAPAAATVLERAGATVVMTSPETLSLTGLPAAEAVAVLGAAGVPFAEVAAEQVSLERAYLDLTREAVEYAARPAPPAPGLGGGDPVSSAGAPANRAVPADGAPAKDVAR